VLARYEGNYAATTLTVMGDRTGFTWQKPETWSRIDELVAEKWQRMRIEPSGLCTDAEFLRRAYLDLTGLPPSSEDVRAFLADPTVAGRLDLGGQDTTELLDLAAGAPGRLIARDAWTAALGQARRLLDAAASPDRGTRMRVALAQGSSGARGKFSDTLDALTVLVHERSRTATSAADDPAALGAAKAMDAIEQAKELAGGNVSPQLVAASLLQEISPLIR